MPIGWYIVPYKRRPDSITFPTRYCEMDDYTPQIEAAGGKWSETEILGNRAIVKLRAPQALLDIADTKFKRLPKNRLDDPLSDLSNQVKKWLRDEVADQGYTVAEINSRFSGNIGDYTLREVITFMASRRLKPRYDSGLDEIICDGIVQNCRPVQDVDAEITE